jgi:hypothetical protein
MQITIGGESLTATEEQSNTKTDEEIVDEFDAFLEQYTGKHENTFELAKILFADTVRVRKDLIVKEFARVLSQVRKESLEQGRRDEREEKLVCIGKYEELLLAVGNKFEGETRHETALRYIKQVETVDTLSPSEEDKGK